MRGARPRALAIAVAMTLAGALLGFAPAAQAAAPTYFTQVGSLRSVEHQGHRYFFADDDQHGLELWRTDGTKAGTGLFVDINPGDADSDGLSAGSLNSDQLDGHFLVSTTGGLYLLGDICTTPACSQSRSYVPGVYRVDIAARKLVLVSAEGFELVANLGQRVLLRQDFTDKTFVLDSKTHTVTEIPALNRLTFDVLHRDLTAAVVKGVAYFAAADEARDTELWRSDGTPAGTYRVADIRTSSSSYPGYFVAGTNRFYFVADDGSNGNEIWTSDGTSAGTVRITNHEVNTGSIRLIVNQPNLVTVGDRLFYYVATAAHGAELWTAKGTAASVALVKDLAPGTANAVIKHPVKAGSKLVFFRPAPGGDDVWVTDGTGAGTRKIASGAGKGTTPNASQYYRQVKDEPAVVAGQVIYTRNDAGVHNLWQSGTTASTTKRIASHSGLSGRPTQLLPVGSRLFYTVPTRAGSFAPTHFLPRFTTITAQKALTKTPTPKITGTAAVGKTLKAVAGTWAPAKVTLKYQWLRGGKAISKATKSTYKLVKADVGKKISVKVTGSKSHYTSVSKTSKAVTARYALTKTPTPKITGTATVGKKLTAVAGTWAPSKVTLKYQWLRAGKAIAGATKSTYTLVAADRGKKVAVKVTGSKKGYATVAKTSAAKTVR